MPRVRLAVVLPLLLLVFLVASPRLGLDLLPRFGGPAPLAGSEGAAPLAEKAVAGPDWSLHIERWERPRFHSFEVSLERGACNATVVWSGMEKEKEGKNRFPSDEEAVSAVEGALAKGC
ncbi:hypothetical protein DFJ74DRAFT_705645 [Hyaloraphidium curvatum]|nr:hypothetical protein DFJ74DRAFT_705645 [Hyaloraphidium curvatum]